MNVILALLRHYASFEIALIVSVPRIYAFMTSSRLFSSASIPALPRTGAILSLTLMVVPVNMDFAERFDWSVGSYLLLFAKEVAIGVMLGYFVAWIFTVMQSVGSLIDNQRGASIASSIDPLQGSDSTPLGNVLSLVFSTYIFATAAVLQVLGLLFASFKIWPVSRPAPLLSSQFPVLILSVFDYAMRLSFDIAAPVIAVMFLAEFALAMVSRFAPQVQVFVLAMPIKSLLAIMMLTFYSLVLFPYANERLLSIGGVVDRFYQILSSGQTLPHVARPGGPAGATP